MSIIERAFEIARSGDCRDMLDLEVRLKREGFEQVHGHISGPSVRKQLRALLEAGHRRAATQSTVSRPPLQ